MRMERLSERAVILRDLPREPFALARTLNEEWCRHPGGISDQVPPASLAVCEEAIASYETIGLYFSAPILDLDALGAEIEPFLNPGEASEGKEVTLPVCYEMGPDLGEASQTLGLSPDDLIQLHLATAYRCYAVGFSPGFAYLGYLNDRIANLPRRPAPRKRVEPGSVGITGRQTAVYPSATPGGWNLIGRCPLEIVNVADGYFPIEAGDTVRFRRIDEAEFSRLEGERL